MISIVKNTLKAAALLALSLQLSGCQNFLDEVNDSAITQKNYFKNAAQAQSAIDGIYDFLRSSFQNRDGFGEAPWTSMELLVGHATTLGGSTYNNNMIGHRAATIDPVFGSVWANLYKGIATANLCIEKIPAVDMDGAQKQKLMGQAYFLRSFYYYNLVRLYGDIPLITATVDAKSPQLYPERAPVKDVYAQIVADLIEAEKSGLPEVDQTGRVSIGAVKSLLSSVYLTMAGQPLNLGESHYKLAATKAKEVLDSKRYSLFNDYYYIHDRAHKNQGELIFQAQFAGTLATNRIISMITPENIGVSKVSEEQGSLMPRNEFVQSYEKGDKRTQEQQFFFSEYLARDKSSVKKFNQYALYKYWMEEAAGTNGDSNSDINWTFFRLPEIMLIYAEAQNEVGGPTADVVAQLKSIRERAALTTPEVANFSKESLREAIWKERYHELCFENKAYFDIQRTHKVFDLKNGKFVDAFTFQNESGVTFSKKYLLWPIPQNERDTNSKLTQNTGW